MQTIVELIESDPFRLSLLEAVASINLPDCYIGAGFVRNLVWDCLHSYAGTALNDIDVIYYSKLPIDHKPILSKLRSLNFDVNWQIKNQAFMHLKNSDEPYSSSSHAMEHWPEIETAVAAQMSQTGKIDVVAPFGVESLFNGYITHNPKRLLAVFRQRVESKNWLSIWPKLKVRC